MLKAGDTSARERGQVVLLFALLLPVFFGLGAIVMDVGNWYIHKRHLQTQVDAAALASAPSFAGCYIDQTAAGVNIAQDALRYAGDTIRDATTANLQLQEPNDVRVTLNSQRYWNHGDPVAAGATGYAPSTDALGDFSAGAPCAISALDVKATDDQAPLLWGLIPFKPSPKTHARVEIHQVREQNGMLPFAVPEIDPEAVNAIFIDDNDGTVLGWSRLHYDQAYDNDGNPTTPFPFSAWVSDDVNSTVQIGGNGRSNNVSVVILISKEDNNPAMPTVGANLGSSGVCTQAPNKVACYGGSAPGSGLSFIHAYQAGGGASAPAPVIRQVQLVGVGCPTLSDFSAPYFTLEGECSAVVNAVVDFGVTGDPRPNPAGGGVCALVESSPGGVMQWGAGGVGGGLGTWTSTIPLDADSGRVSVDIDWWSGPRSNGNCGNKNQHPNNGSFAKVSGPYVSDAASGPVQYLQLRASQQATCPVGATLVSDANSVEKGHDYCYRVAVGLEMPLRLQPTTNDPILLRFASKAQRKSGNLAEPLTQALDCDHGIKLEIELRDGCKTFYAVNYDDWDNNPATPKTWADILCSQYGPNDLSPPNFVNNPTPICVAPKGGQVQDMQKGLADRWETPCTPNYWPQKNASQAEVDDFLANHDFANDPRYVTLIITDDTAFQSPSQNEPVKYFAGFYATGWDKGGPKAEGCDRTDQYMINGGLQSLPSNLFANDCHPLLSTSTGPAPSRSEPCTSYNKVKDNGDVWGHFVKFVVFSGAAVPNDNLCPLTSDSPETCVATLVE